MLQYFISPTLYLLFILTFIKTFPRLRISAWLYLALFLSLTRSYAHLIPPSTFLLLRRIVCSHLCCFQTILLLSLPSTVPPTRKFSIFLSLCLYFFFRAFDLLSLGFSHRSKSRPPLLPIDWKMLYFTVLPPPRPPILLLLYSSTSSSLQHFVPLFLRSSGASTLCSAVLQLLCSIVAPFIVCSVILSLRVSFHWLRRLPVHSITCCCRTFPPVHPPIRLPALPSPVPSSLDLSVSLYLRCSVPPSHRPSVSLPLFLSISFEDKCFALKTQELLF